MFLHICFSNKIICCHINWDRLLSAIRHHLKCVPVNLKKLQLRRINFKNIQMLMILTGKAILLCPRPQTEIYRRATFQRKRLWRPQCSGKAPKIVILGFSRAAQMHLEGRVFETLPLTICCLMVNLRTCIWSKNSL